MYPSRPSVRHRRMSWNPSCFLGYDCSLCTSANDGSSMETLLQDVRHSVRMLAKAPGFAVVAVLTLALGIGASAAIFQLIDAVRLRTLPVSDPQYSRYRPPEKEPLGPGQFQRPLGGFDKAFPKVLYKREFEGWRCVCQPQRSIEQTSRLVCKGELQ